jgi:Flp pilus assembly protein TadD
MALVFIKSPHPKSVGAMLALSLMLSAAMPAQAEAALLSGAAEVSAYIPDSPYLQRRQKTQRVNDGEDDYISMPAPEPMRKLHFPETAAAPVKPAKRTASARQAAQPKTAQHSPFTPPPKSIALAPLPPAQAVAAAPLPEVPAPASAPPAHQNTQIMPTSAVALGETQPPAPLIKDATPPLPKAALVVETQAPAPVLVDTAPPLPPAAAIRADKAAAAMPVQPPPALVKAQPPVLVAPPPQVADERSGPQLSPESKRILADMPPLTEKEPPQPKRPPVTLNRATPSALSIKDDVKQHDGIGIHIQVRKPNIDINTHLEKAYQAAMDGDLKGAAMLYQEVLEVSPESTQALFGLASVDQKMGRLDEARPLYGRLLKLDPHNQGALNNFLVLVGEEAPQDALAKLKDLELKNPDFSPIPAQIAVISARLGNYDDAVRSMTRAMALSPGNLTYRYNLAIMLDKQKNWPEAANLYLQLINAADRGEKLPAPRHSIEERLTFIRNNKPDA